MAKGAPTPASFKKGQSGNPKGRPKEFPWFREECRKRTNEALGVLDSVMRGLVPFEVDGQTKLLPAEPKDRIKAVELLLGYAWGKPPQALSGEGGEGDAKVTVKIEGVDKYL